jgi:hypothetical protein
LHGADVGVDVVVTAGIKGAAAANTELLLIQHKSSTHCKRHAASIFLFLLIPLADFLLKILAKIFLILFIIYLS